ncbi:hypothetical protein [Methylobacterium goesingense]|uniref:Uncharacterized protein n=1 Tax=Methylobacterium goesingense TaxID=243690 RepID=A0ABV2L6N3_9HYPH|nr:hypothetical protein [Methylobacterium goesingense]GJD75132.1 hypothetical protein CFIICLFH_3372 [Methylobacterium goesingense]
MNQIPNRPLFTQLIRDTSSFRPPPGSTYIYGRFEERTSLVETWSTQASGVRFIELEELATPIVRPVTGGYPEFSLRQQTKVEGFLKSIGTVDLYLDITGLSFHVWAPLIKVAVNLSFNLKVVYIEPADYSYSLNPMRGEIFDLSERTLGIAPVPLFASLSDPEDQTVCFIPLLGFEGARLAYMIEQVDPPGSKIIPIIGVPGFRVEYPFNTYHGNEPALSNTRAWQKVRFATANCPFSAFYALTDVIETYESAYIKVAPIGTRPHALGALLKCLASHRPIEIVYDHPKRHRSSSSGSMNCLVYHVADFLNSNPMR